MALFNWEAEKKKLDKVDKDEWQELLNDISTTFNSGEGRRVLHHLLSICGVYSDNFTGNSAVYYNEGKRAIGLQLLELVMEADPRIYIKTLEDNSDAIG